MRGLGRMTARALLLASVSGGALAFSATAKASGEPVTFDIEGQALETALKEFAEQSNREIFAPGALAVSKRTMGVSGNLEPEAALDALLDGTGLVYTTNEFGTLLIAQASEEVERVDGRMLLAQAETGAGTSTGRSREKIIVTGQKRDEYIQDVPIAISAFSQEDLTLSQIAGGPDLVTQIPNFTFTKTNFSGYSIQIRGIGTQAISATTDPAVAVAFNSTPFIRNRFFEQEFYDMERVEVLRGPQGTLYGRNATGGVVNLISAKPVLGEDEARASLDLGNYNSQRLEAMVNVPLVDDQVALRLAGAWTQRDGYATNELSGNPIDGRDLWSTRLSLRMAPNDRIDANLIWEHFEENDDRIRSGKQLCKKHVVTELAGYPVQPTGALQQQLSQGCIRASLYSDESFQTPNGQTYPFYQHLDQVGLPTAPGVEDPYVSQVQSKDLRVIESMVDPHYSAETDTVEFQVAFELTDSLTLNSDTAWLSDFIFATQDYNRFNTKSGVWQQTNARPGVLDNGTFCDPQIGCSDRLVAMDLSTANSTQFTQEFRLSSQFAGSFNFSLGANYLRYDTHEKYYVFINALSLYSSSAFTTKIPEAYVPGVSQNLECMQRGPEVINIDAGGGVATGGAHCVYMDPNPIGNLNDLGHNYFLSNNPYKLISYAAFGEAYYDLTDNLKLTAGLRWTVDKKEAPRIPSWVLARRAGYPVLEVVEQEWKEPTGRLALDWKPSLSFTDETLIYVSYAHGYKAGGANPPPAAVALNVDTGNGQPEPSVTHPRLFDAEYVDAFEIGSKNTFLDGDVTLNLAAFYYDYEGYQISEIVDRSAINRNFDAEVWGLEIEAEWWARENLRLSFKGGYEDTRIADGEEAVDLMDRTAGNPDWVVVKPFPVYPSNCIVPVHLLTGGGQNAALQELGNVHGSADGPCDMAYFRGLDILTSAPYVPITPPSGPNWPNGGGGAVYIDYMGFDPASAPNNGEGFSKKLGGNELPNAPNYTATLSGDYILPLGTDWTLTFHTDLYYQAESWWRVFQDHEYARLNEYYTMNLAAILKSEDGWNIMGYIKNVTDETAITGAFLNSDDTGLTTNVFLTEPRLYGLRITKDWTGGTFLGGLIDGERHDPSKPYKFQITLGGQIQRWDAPHDPAVPNFLGEFSPGLVSLDDQTTDLDWGDGRDVRVTYEPGNGWTFAAGVRFGRTNGWAEIANRYEEGDRVCAVALPVCMGGASYLKVYNYLATDRTFDNEEHTLVDFTVGREVGLGGLAASKLLVGLRHAQFESDTSTGIFGRTNWDIPIDDQSAKYGSMFQTTHEEYEVDINIDREFQGVGPTLGWEATAALIGDEDTGVLGLDWSVAGGVLYGKRKTRVTGEEIAQYFSQPTNEVPGVIAAPMSEVSTMIDIERSEDVSVPTVGAALGLSYQVDRFRIGAGYRWERYYDVIDGGYAAEQEEDRTIDGPYFNVTVGFGG